MSSGARKSKRRVSGSLSNNNEELSAHSETDIQQDSRKVISEEDSQTEISDLPHQTSPEGSPGSAEKKASLEAAAKAKLRKLIQSEVTRPLSERLGSEKSSLPIEDDQPAVGFRKVKKGNAKFRRTRDSESPSDRRAPRSTRPENPNRNFRRSSTDRRDSNRDHSRGKSSPIKSRRTSTEKVKRNSGGTSNRREDKVTVEVPKTPEKVRPSKAEVTDYHSTGNSRAESSRKPIEAPKSPRSKNTKNSDKSRSRISWIQSPLDSTGEKSSSRRKNDGKSGHKEEESEASKVSRKHKSKNNARDSIREVFRASSESDDEMKRSFDSKPTPAVIPKPVEKETVEEKKVNTETVEAKGKSVAKQKRIVVPRETSPIQKNSGPKISINISTSNNSKAQKKLAELADSKKIEEREVDQAKNCSPEANGEGRTIPVLTTDRKTGRKRTDAKSDFWERLGSKSTKKNKNQKAAEDFKKADELLTSESDTDLRPSSERSGNSPALFPLANPFAKASKSSSPVKAPKPQTWTPENAPKDLANKIRKPKASIDTSIPPPPIPSNGMKRNVNESDSSSRKKKKYMSEGGNPNSTPRHPRISAPSPEPEDSYGPPLPPDMEGGTPGGSSLNRSQRRQYMQTSSSHHSSTHRRPSKLLGESRSHRHDERHRYDDDRFSSGHSSHHHSHHHRHHHHHSHKHHSADGSDEEEDYMRDVYKKKHDYDPEEERRKLKEAKEFDDKMKKRKRRGLPWVEKFESEKGEVPEFDGLSQEVIDSLEPDIREMLEENKFTHFFTKKFIFSNHWPCSITLEGKDFVCSEQYYMWRKAVHFGDQDSANSILATDDPKKIKQIGSYVMGFDQEEWDRVSGKIMTKVTKAKYVQNQELLQGLFSTRGTVLVETNPNDVRWGIGLSMDDFRAWDYKQWRGSNKLGFILTKLRENMWVNERFAEVRKAYLRNPNPTIKTQYRE